MTSERAERSEKRPARELITELAPNVLRTELPINLPGLGHVNMYLLQDGDGVSVVDPGLPGDDAWKALEHRLGLAGYRVRDVHSIIVTHSHFDHFGGAKRLAAESGARIVAHPELHLRGRGPSVDDDTEFLDPDEAAEYEDRNRGPDRNFGHRTRWGTWSEPPAQVVDYWRHIGLDQDMMAAPRPDVGVTDGLRLELGEREWVAVHTPGHTVDHLCLFEPDSGLMITGDHVLPTITPHISGDAHGEAPLQRFFDSLQRMHDYADVKLALPAHGDPFTDLHDRSDHICAHHHERLDELILAADDLGRADVESYMRRIFKERSWGNLAASETFAHLDHLSDRGDLTTSWQDGLLQFEPSPSAPSH